MVDSPAEMKKRRNLINAWAFTRRIGPFMLLWGMLIISWIIGGAAIFYLHQRVDDIRFEKNDGDNREVIDMIQRVSQLEDRLENGQGAKPVDSTEKIIQDQRLAMRIANLEQKMAEATEWVDQAQKDGKLAPVLIALSDIRLSLDQGLPFADSVELARLSAPRDSAIQIKLAYLAGLTNLHLSTVSELRARFKDISPAIFAAGRYGDEKVSRFRHIWRQITGLVSYRKVTTEGNSLEAMITRAQNALDQGNLNRAIEEVLALENSYSAAFDAAEPWLKEAQATSEAYGQVRGIYQRIVFLAEQKAGTPGALMPKVAPMTLPLISEPQNPKTPEKVAVPETSSPSVSAPKPAIVPVP